MNYKEELEQNTAYLSHFGVLGMRWGVRRAKSPNTVRLIGNKIMGKQITIDSEKARISKLKAKAPSKIFDPGRRELRINQAEANLKYRQTLQKGLRSRNPESAKYADKYNKNLSNMKMTKKATLDLLSVPAVGLATIAGMTYLNSRGKPEAGLALGLIGLISVSSLSKNLDKNVMDGKYGK